MNIIHLDTKKAETESLKRELLRNLQELDLTIRSVQATTNLFKNRQVRNSLNTLKNARYLLKRELDRLGK